MTCLDYFRNDLRVSRLIHILARMVIVTLASIAGQHVRGYIDVAGYLGLGQASVSIRLSSCFSVDAVKVVLISHFAACSRACNGTGIRTSNQLLPVNGQNFG